MAKEYFWGTTLSKDKKVCKWDPEAEFLDDDDDDDDYAISHFLFLKQAVLGAEVEDTERNVVEVETVNFDGDKVKQPLFSLKLGLNESTPLDMGLQPPVTFKLVKGSGPVFISGQHALDLQEDEDFGEDFKEGEGEETSDEDVDEKEVEEELKVKKVSTKGKDKKKAAVKDVKVPTKGKGDELDDEDEEDEDEDEDEEEEEEEEEEKQTAKGKKRPAPSAKGPAKKMSKPAFDDEDDDDEDDDDDDDEDAIDWKMALGDEDDEDDDEEDDEDDEGMDDEDEEDEDEEEESSPEKPAKKAKGKVNGTVKPKGTSKSQQSKSKDKKTFTMEDMKQDLIKSPSKPKKEDKFKNFVKSRFHLSEAKKIQELWGWYKSTQLK